MKLNCVNLVKQFSVRIKKIVLLLICLSVFTTPAYAKISKTVNNHGIFISSRYVQIIAEKDEAKYVIGFSLERHKLNSGLVAASPDFSLSIKALAISTTSPATIFAPDQYFDPLIVFSFKTPPKFEITKDNSVQTITVTGKTGIDTHNIIYNLSKQKFFGGPAEKLAVILPTAEKITVIMPFNNDTEIRIELPEEIVKEWNYISTADMKKEKKEVLNR